MSTVSSDEAQTHLLELLQQVAKGQDVTITRDGLPVAKLVPVRSPTPADTPAPVAEGKKLTPREAIEGILELRKGHTLGGLTLRELIEEGRRY